MTAVVVRATLSMVVLTGLGLFLGWAIVAIRDRRRARRLTALIMAAQTYRDEVNGAPVIGVPLDCLDLLAPWDVLTEVDDEWRFVCLEYLEQMWALPARERAS